MCLLHKPPRVLVQGLGLSPQDIPGTVPWSSVCAMRGLLLLALVLTALEGWRPHASCAASLAGPVTLDSLGSWGVGWGKDGQC